MAGCPASLANLAAVIFYGLFKRGARVELYDVLGSRHAKLPSRLAARVLGVNLR